MLNDHFKNRKSGRPVIQGHRGFRGLYPENTLTAFTEALKLGVDALELDVVLSKEDELIVSHEPWMNSLFCTDPDGQVVPDNRDKYNLYRMTYEEIRSFDCGKRQHPDFPQQKTMPEHKPLLRELVAHIESFIHEHSLAPVVYNIEVKTEAPEGLFNPAPEVFAALVYKEVLSYLTPGRIHLQSFDVRILRALRNMDAGLSIGLLVENKEGLQRNLDYLGFVPDVYSPDFELVTSSLVKDVQQRGMQLVPWTVNETGDMERLLEWGVNGIITDYPNRAMGLLDQKTKNKHLD